MSNVIELKVPDIGDAKNVEVIEVFVKVGDSIAKEDSLITLETDKASMEVPASAAGVVKEIRIKVGDKVSEGSVMLLLEARDAAAASPAAPLARRTRCASCRPCSSTAACQPWRRG